MTVWNIIKGESMENELLDVIDDETFEFNLSAISDYNNHRHCGFDGIKEYEKEDEGEMAYNGRKIA